MSVGAAVAAAAMLIHGVWPVSVNIIPQNPAPSTWRAKVGCVGPPRRTDHHVNVHCGTPFMD